MEVVCRPASCPTYPVFAPAIQLERRSRWIAVPGVGALDGAVGASGSKTLTAEGLFAEDRKQGLALSARVSIGVVTSPHRRGDPRHPASPARPVSRAMSCCGRLLVQGDGAVRPQMTRRRFAGFNAHRIRRAPVPRPDVLIVARGGGSIEDLWAFNEEIVVTRGGGERDPADLAPLVMRPTRP